MTRYHQIDSVRNDEYTFCLFICVNNFVFCVMNDAEIKIIILAWRRDVSIEIGMNGISWGEYKWVLGLDGNWFFNF